MENNNGCPLAILVHLNYGDRPLCRDCIMIGEKYYWNKGYGTGQCNDGAPRFRNLNLHRIWLQVYKTQPARDSRLRKSGFQARRRFREGHYHGRHYWMFTDEYPRQEWDKNSLTTKAISMTSPHMRHDLLYGNIRLFAGTAPQSSLKKYQITSTSRSAVEM